MTSDRPRGLLERLQDGTVICAEGYLFEFERRGYLQAGAFVPEIVLEHPDLVAGLHREFVHAGSDVVEAFTYYAHREKMRIIGKEHLIEPLQPRRARDRQEGRRRDRQPRRRRPLQHERVLSATRHRRREVRGMFEEQVGWIVEAGMDYVVAETFSYAEEALLALEVIKDAGLHGGRDARDPPRPRDARGLVAGRSLRAARRRRRRCRRAQLHPRTADDAAADRARSARRSTAMSPRCRCPTAPPRRSRASSR